MEIERKFTVKEIPYNLNDFECLEIEQGYICVNPVVRIRKENDNYYLTYKSKGKMEREEYNLPLNMESYVHLKTKVDGNLISKKRYLIPCEIYTIELDIFMGKFDGLIIAEVEFNSKEEAIAFIPPEWFDEDVTFSKEHHNSYLSTLKEFK